MTWPDYSVIRKVDIGVMLTSLAIAQALVTQFGLTKQLTIRPDRKPTTLGPC